MRIEIIHNRYLDDACEHTVFVDGHRESVSVDRRHLVHLDSVDLRANGSVTVSVDVYDVDPGRGYQLEDWNESTAHDCAQASEHVAAELRRMRDEIAASSEYIEREA